MSKRIDYLDVLKGIGIILMIIGHSYGRNTTLGKFIFSFHMPLFFLISGYFFKPKDPKYLFTKNVYRLLVPYISTCILMTLLALFKNILSGNNTSIVIKDWIIASMYGMGSSLKQTIIPNVKPIGAIWFLLALFLSECFFNSILKLKKYMPLYLPVALSAYIGISTSKYIWLPLSVQAALVSVVFLYVGYISKEHDILKYTPSKSIIIIMGLTWVICIKFSSISMVSNYYKTGLLDMIGGICGTYYFVYISKFISKYTKYIKSALTFIGKETLVILCFHLIELNLFPWHKLIKLLSNYFKIQYEKPTILVFKFIWVVLIAIFLKYIPLLKNFYYPKVKKTSSHKVQC